MSTRALARLLPVAFGLTCFALSLEPPAFAQTSPLRTVLTLYWSSESFPGTPELDRGIQEALRSSSDRLDYFAEYLESDRFPDEQASAALSDYLRQKYRGQKIDVVIAVTGVALQFALRYRADLFPDAPIVFSGAVDASDLGVRNAGPGLTGLLTSASFGETLQLVLTIHPTVTRVFYVAGATDPALRASMRAQLQTAARHVELIDIDEPSIPGLIAAVKAVPRGSVILYLRYSQDDPGNVQSPPEIAPMVAQAAVVPVYGAAEQFLGTGIVGGVMFSRQQLAARLGAMVREILHGTRAQDIPIEQIGLVPMFDWRQLRRRGIAERSLPAGSIVLFRETPVWESYRGPIIATLSVLLLQSSLIAGLVIERRRRRQAEHAARRSLAAMAHLDRRAAMGELATSLAHELNQPLNAILQNAGVARMLLDSNPVPPALGELADIVGDIRNDDIRASEVIRRMRQLLQKREVESLPVDLNEAARDAAAIVEPDARSRGIQLDSVLEDGLRPVLGDRVHLQQVILNLLMNAIDAVTAMPPDRRRVQVVTSRRDGEVRLAVVDRGAGIPADRLSEIFEPFYTTKSGGGMGMGLAIARSIVEAHAGRIAAENNAAGGGATVWFSIPEAESHQGAIVPPPP